ncbi:autoinducer binding domain-containing protein [Mesorhizobium tianshanense]|uniref:autoinducer binding domain-containing protein n=1 Tax=Mesorhizobium tianshanense TaxID=39844 RepID=UPI001391DBCD|nr:autoinducer binding domain-containing protein [Mesorhizobium tianshanense]
MPAKLERVLDDHLDGLIDAMELARDEPSIKTALQEFATDSGFEHFAYFSVRVSDARGLSNYPLKWQERYVSNNYVTLDPVIAQAKRLMRPFTWSMKQMQSLGRAERKFFDEAAEFGIRSGISIPVKAGFGRTVMLTLATNRDEPGPVVVRDVALAATAVAFVHISLIRLSAKLPRTGQTDLSPREATCLAWASIGKTMNETAKLLTISERSVRFYLEQARDKLGANNVAHAVRLAVERDLI